MEAASIKRVLITGGAGSIGSEVARRMLSDGWAVRVMDINEEGLWSLKLELPQIEVVLGDVRYVPYEFMDKCDAVIHCAALKHVDLCEPNISLAWDVNVDGTEEVVTNSRLFKIPTVFLSTDKAHRPRSIMGQTKRAAEKIALTHNAQVVRFGNVLGTRGSLIPAVKRYAALGRPIPVTDPDMTRFFMTVEDAVNLVYVALAHAQQLPWKLTPAIITPLVFSHTELQSARIGLFVEVCRDLLAPGHPIEVTGPRPGESTHETMGDIRSDDASVLMDREQIEQLLERAGVLEGISA